MTALLIVDMQNDFMPGGVLGVPGADQIVPCINQLSTRFPLIIACQDWHPSDHCSFAPNHPQNKPGDTVQIGTIEQILWPVHCVRFSHGAELVDRLNRNMISSVFYKGTDRLIDGYSAFVDNAQEQSTGLGDFLKTRYISRLYLVGIATDYCILYSACDAIELGFSVIVVSDACRPINLHPDDEKKALETMRGKGVQIQTSMDVLSSLID